MSEEKFPVPVVTCTITEGGAFLIARRPASEEKYSSTWAFPGGKIESNENAIQALVREVREETGLELTDRIMFLNSYVYSGSVGFHFVVESVDRNVVSEEFLEYYWISTLEEMRAL